jgi:hypothetical protein
MIRATKKADLVHKSKTTKLVRKHEPGIVPLTMPSELSKIQCKPKVNLTYHGGPLLTEAQVYTIFWGAGWSTDLINDLVNFFQFILSSSLIDQLKEYSVPSFHIGHGKFMDKHIEFDPILKTVDDKDIQVLLTRLTGFNTLPPSANTLYFVFIPPGITVSRHNEKSCTGFCGYHDSFISNNNNIYYAVMPFPDCSGCHRDAPNFPFDALTLISSHELCEAITDPLFDDRANIGLGWVYDEGAANDMYEIGDICYKTRMRLGGYLVQQEWSNLANKCSLRNGEIAQISEDVLTQFTDESKVVDVAGYYADADLYQHVIVANNHGFLKQISWKPQGSDPKGPFQDDLGTGFSNIVGVAGYYADSDKFHHAIVATKDGTVTEIFWKFKAGHVIDKHQGPLASIPNIVDVAGYYADDDKYQHVIVGINNVTLTEIYWNPNDSDKSDISQEKLVAINNTSILGVAGYYGFGDKFHHVITGDIQGKTRELYWKPLPHC